MPRNRGGGAVVGVFGVVRAPASESASTVLDNDGNPLVVSAVVQYQIVDTYRAAIEINYLEGLLYSHAEATLKQVIGQYPYDAEEGTPCLRRDVRQY